MEREILKPGTRVKVTVDRFKNGAYSEYIDNVYLGKVNSYNINSHSTSWNSLVSLGWYRIDYDENIKFTRDVFDFEVESLKDEKTDLPKDMREAADELESLISLLHKHEIERDFLSKTWLGGEFTQIDGKWKLILHNDGYNCRDIELKLEADSLKGVLQKLIDHIDC